MSGIYVSTADRDDSLGVFGFLNGREARSPRIFFPSSPESRLLLACVSSTQNPDQVRELTRKELDWHWIVSRAEDYAIAPLVYSNLKKLALDG